MKLLALRKVYGPEPDMNTDQQIRVHQKRPDPKVDSDTRCLPLFFFFMILTLLRLLFIC